MINMEKLQAICMECLNELLVQIVLSGARQKEGPQKIKIRPITQKGTLLFQASEQWGKQEKHKNYGKEELTAVLQRQLREDFKQMQMLTTTETITALSGKKGNLTIKRKKRQTEGKAVSLEHNRKKRYILEEGIPVPFLVDLGVMTTEGKVVKARYDKYRQINRFLEFVEDVLPHLEAKSRDENGESREVTILDFGCGKSYLTFAVYYYLHELKKLDVRIIGLDLKEDVIRNCSSLAEKYGYDKLTFLTGDIAEYEGVTKVDMVVTLHACDTATDYALDKAVKWGAQVILSVPCCQHELNGQIHCETLEPVLKYGLIKERMAALITDALRAGRLEEQGYQVQILEFIDMEHTPKNILIRGVRTGTKKENKKLDVCGDFLGVDPLLGRLLKG
jgi:SAM-dependent methyltransferase